MGKCKAYSCTVSDDGGKSNSCQSESSGVDANPEKAYKQKASTDVYRMGPTNAPADAFKHATIDASSAVREYWRNVTKSEGIVLR